MKRARDRQSTAAGQDGSGRVSLIAGGATRPIET